MSIGGIVFIALLLLSAACAIISVAAMTLFPLENDKAHRIAGIAIGIGLITGIGMVVTGMLGSMGAIQ